MCVCEVLYMALHLFYDWEMAVTDAMYSDAMYCTFEKISILAGSRAGISRESLFRRRHLPTTSSLPRLFGNKKDRPFIS